MGTDSSASDGTGWSTLSANGGHLMLESGIAERCARHVETMLNTAQNERPGSGASAASSATKKYVDPGALLTGVMRYGKSQVRDSYPDLERHAAACLNHPGRMVGAIETPQGRSVFGPREILTRRIYRHDLVDVGRYVIPDTSAPVAVGADPCRLAAPTAIDVAMVSQTLEKERGV